MTKTASRAARACLALVLAAGLARAERVVAIGDLHGAYDEFLTILQETGLIDKDLAWAGGKTTLVQTGDVLDRGPKSRLALDLLMTLSEKAPAQGGEVKALLGNHETMVMMGDLRYVSAEEYAAFAGPDSEALRQKEWESYLKYRKSRNSRTRRPAPTDADKEVWLKTHPPGYFEFRQAFSPQGKYGKWLRSRDAVAQVGEVVFLHGGLSPELSLKNVKEINDTVHKEIARMDELHANMASRGVTWPYMTMEEAQAEAKMEWDAQQAGVGDVQMTALLQQFLSLSKWNILAPTGPLWYRGYAQDDEAELGPQLDKVLKKFKVRHVVVGHTIPGSKRITSRLDGRVFMIDTGMLTSHFQGRPSALEINGGSFKAIYVGEPAQMLLADGAGKTP